MWEYAVHRGSPILSRKQQIAAVQINDITAVNISQPRDVNPATVYLAGLSLSSRRTMKAALDTVAALLAGYAYDLARCASKPPACDLALSFQWQTVRYQHVQLVRATLAQHIAPSSVNRNLAALRSTLKVAWRLGLMAAEDYQQAAAVKGVRGSRRKAGRAVSNEELKALLDACTGSDHKAIRDAAMLAVMYACGLRRAEIVALDVSDFATDSATLVIHGKGDKLRIVPVADAAVVVLKEWLLLRGNQKGPLFCGLTPHHQLRHRHRISTQAVYNVVRERAAEAGITDVSPHDLRRTFASELLDAGVDLALVQQLMGHSQVSTTAGYDRRPETAKHKAVNKLAFPGR